MTESQIAAIVSRVRCYLATRQGARKVWNLMYGPAACTLDRAIAEIAMWAMVSCHNGRLREAEASYEDLTAITERVIEAEWTGRAA